MQQILLTSEHEWSWHGGCADVSCFFYAKQWAPPPEKKDAWLLGQKDTSLQIPRASPDSFNKDRKIPSTLERRTLLEELYPFHTIRGLMQSIFSYLHSITLMTHVFLNVFLLKHLIWLKKWLFSKVANIHIRLSSLDFHWSHQGGLDQLFGLFLLFLRGLRNLSDSYLHHMGKSYRNDHHMGNQ